MRITGYQKDFQDSQRALQLLTTGGELETCQIELRSCRDELMACQNQLHLQQAAAGELALAHTALQTDASVQEQDLELCQQELDLVKTQSGRIAESSAGATCLGLSLVSFGGCLRHFLRCVVAVFCWSHCFPLSTACVSQLPPNSTQSNNSS